MRVLVLVGLLAVAAPAVAQDRAPGAIAAVAPTPSSAASRRRVRAIRPTRATP